MRRSAGAAALLLIAALGTPAWGEAPSQQRAVAGWVETGFIGVAGGKPIKVKVKLDTGAKTSSIHAAQVRGYERDGERRVSFVLTNNEGAELAVDRPVVRTVTIRRAGTELQDRPVVTLRICVAGITGEAEFTMADRSELSYPVLVGRAFLAEKILVDSARTFVASGLCKAE